MRSTLIELTRYKHPHNPHHISIISYDEAKGKVSKPSLFSVDFQNFQIYNIFSLYLEGEFMATKFIRCKVCGQMIPQNAKMCPYCWSNNKRPFYKKPVFWALVCFFFLILVFGNGSDDKGSAENTAETRIEATVEESIDTSTEATTEATTETLPPVDVLLGIINKSLAGTFDDNSVEIIDSGIVVSIACDGLAEDMTLMKAQGFDETYSDWVTFRDAMVLLCRSYSDAAEELGLENTIIYLNVLNDQNKDNILLGIVNGAVLYDMMAE